MCAIGASLAPLLCAAASGRMDSFSASALTVVEGEKVHFTALYSVSTPDILDGGGSPNEPAPIEGSQLWLIDWYYWQKETLGEIELVATGGQKFTDRPAVSDADNYNGAWNFSILYPTKGSYIMAVTGAWVANVEIAAKTEYATRECVNADNGGDFELQCSSWEYWLSEYEDTYKESSYFAGLVTIEVIAAPVPEVSTAALWLAGLIPALGLSKVARRRVSAT